MNIGIGPGRDMQKSLERNKKLINKRNSLKENYDSGNKNYTELNIKEFSVSEIESAKRKFLISRKKANKKKLITLTVIVTSIFLVLYLLFY